MSWKTIEHDPPIIVKNSRGDHMIITAALKDSWYGFVQGYSGTMYWSKSTGSAKGAHSSFPSYDIPQKSLVKLRARTAIP